MDGMDSGISKDGGAFAAAPPPVDGLGNYKGVMLCNRPVEESHPARMRGSADAGVPAFKSTISPGERDQLGLQPCKKMEARSVVKTRGPSAALRRHMQWIKELQVQVAEEHQRAADDEQRGEERQQRMQVLFKQQRDAIKDLKSKKDDIDARQLVSLLEGKAKGEAKAKSRKAKKPLWAMTEEEKEGAEDEEADALIDFAENLDYEKYLGDCEFRECLQVVRDRAKKLQREQDKFKDDILRDFNAQADDDGDAVSDYTGSQIDARDGSSVMGDMPGRTGPARRPRGPDAGSDWDSSTVCDDEGRRVNREARSDAGSVLDANPQLKAIHSKESMQRIIERTREGPPSTAG